MGTDFKITHLRVRIFPWLQFLRRQTSRERLWMYEATDEHVIATTHINSPSDDHIYTTAQRSNGGIAVRLRATNPALTVATYVKKEATITSRWVIWRDSWTLTFFTRGIVLNQIEDFLRIQGRITNGHFLGHSKVIHFRVVWTWWGRCTFTFGFKIHSDICVYIL